MEDKIWYFKYLFGKYNDRWYISLFDKGKNKICGEITPAYSILDVEDVENVYKLTPSIKIIFIMRNPIEKAWSQFKHLATRRGRNLNSFSEKEIIEPFNSRDFMLRGDYLRTLSNWQRFYS